MATTVELEKKVAALEHELSEVKEAISRQATEVARTLESVSSLRAEVSKELQNLILSTNKAFQQLKGQGVSVSSYK